MRDFERVADFLIPHRRIVHIVVLVISLLMVPGMILALSPIDMESYNMESPELDAREVILKEYPANVVTSGYAVIIREQSKVGTEPHWVYVGVPAHKVKEKPADERAQKAPPTPDPMIDPE